jgi:hypothetical protein
VVVGTLSTGDPNALDGATLALVEDGGGRFRLEGGSWW